MSGLLAPTLREERLGEAQILEVFNVSKVGKVAGCRVLDGVVAARRPCPPHPRQRRDPRRQAVAAQALQGRRPRGHGRPGMRHGLRELPGHARRRRHRVLQRRARCGGRCRPASHRACRAARQRRPGDGSPCTGPTCDPSPGRLRRLDLSLRDEVAADPVRSRRRPCRNVPNPPPARRQRQQRVAELVRHALAEVLARGDLQDPVLTGHVITIPEVRMSPDLRLATAYVMPLGGQDEAAVLAALERNRKHLRHEVAPPRQPQIRARPALPARRQLRRGGAHRRAPAQREGAARFGKAPGRRGRLSP